jgi:hypothetical protein
MYFCELSKQNFDCIVKSKFRTKIIMNNTLRQFIQYISVFILLLLGTSAFAQEVTKVKGKVTDASSGEPLIFVDVGFVGPYV